MYTLYTYIKTEVYTPEVDDDNLSTVGYIIGYLSVQS